MKIHDFIGSFKYLRCATEEDNEKILNYYNFIGMQSDFSNIKFKRDPDFFKHLSYVGPSSYSLIIEDKDGNTDGGFAMVIRPCYIDGKMENVAYMCDLRFRRDRVTDFSWMEFARELFTKGENIEELNGCRYYVSSVVDTNLIAKRAFTKKTKPTDADSPAQANYLAWYDMVNILARKPLKLIKKKTSFKSDLKLSVSIATDDDRPELEEFLDKQNRIKDFGYVFNSEYSELERRFKDWDNFSMSSFYLARDNSGEILGCFATWDPSKGRRIVLNKFPKYLNILRMITKLFGKKVPGVGSPLEILYLTHLEIDHKLTIEQKRDIFNALLDALYGNGTAKKYHFLSFGDFNVNELAPGIEKHYFLQKTPNVFFQCCCSETKKVLKIEDIKVPPGHELALA